MRARSAMFAKEKFQIRKLVSTRDALLARSWFVQVGSAMARDHFSLHGAFSSLQDRGRAFRRVPPV